MLLEVMILLIGVAEVPAETLALSRPPPEYIPRVDATKSTSTLKENIPSFYTLQVQTKLPSMLMEETTGGAILQHDFQPSPRPPKPIRRTSFVTTSKTIDNTRSAPVLTSAVTIPFPQRSKFSEGTKNGASNNLQTFVTRSPSTKYPPNDNFPTKSPAQNMKSEANLKSTSKASLKTTTTQAFEDKSNTAYPVLTVKPVKSEASTLNQRMHARSETQSTLPPPTKFSGTQRATLKSVSRQLTTRKLITSLTEPVSTVPLPYHFQKHTEIPAPPNAVEQMRLGWISQGATSEFSEDENVLHPTLPSLFSRRPTKSLRGNRPHESKKPTTTSKPLAFETPNEQCMDLNRCGISTSSALSSSNQLLPHTTSIPERGTSVGDRSFFQRTQSLPVVTRHRNDSTFPVSTGIAPIGSSNVRSLESRFFLETSVLNQSAPRPIFLSSTEPVRKSKTISPRTWYGKQSLVHLVPLGSAFKAKSEDPLTVPPFPVPTRERDQFVFDPIEDASVGNLKLIAPSPSPTTRTEILPPNILPTLAVMDIMIENETRNCTNDYCVSDEDYLDMMLSYMFPAPYEWVLIGMHSLVFIGGLVGNALVCSAVYRNHSMRTVTNYFIVNLAVADFLVILLCLPPTVLWDVTETWFMGTALCKTVLYFQTVSVAVSVLTLTFISIDRWYAICCPLKFKSTTGRAKTAILVIWVLALLFDIPELVVLQTERKDLPVDTLFFTQCQPSWSDKTDMAFHCLKTLLLYTVPLVFMTIAYCQIVKVLWSTNNIPGHQERLYSSSSNAQSSTSCHSETICRKTVKRCISAGAASVSTAGQVICRRKASKMLVAVVIMFAVCYFPVHLLSILRYTYDIPQTDATTAFSMVSHWLCYANSAVNPLIYNFMSGKFRKEFAKTFGCHRVSWRRPAGLLRRRRRHPAVATSGGCAAQRTEMAPLSRDCATNVVNVENPC